MGLYNVSVRCPHCGGSTFVDEMDTGKFRWAEALLKPVLERFHCGHCSGKFGADGVLIRNAITPN